MIRVKKTIDLQIDLNAYYPSFPAGLRRAIDEEVIRLCSTGGKGEKVDHIVGSKRPKYFWSKLPDDALVFLAKEMPTRGAMRQVFSAAHRKWAVGEEILFLDFKTLVSEELSMIKGGTVSWSDIQMFLSNACHNPPYFRVKEDS